MEAKKSALIRGLSRELQQALIYVDTPADFDETVKLLQKLDNRQRAVNQANYATSPRANSASAMPPSFSVFSCDLC